MSPVLKYHDGTAWTEVANPGPAGDAGPPGPIGPAGSSAVTNLGDLSDVDTAGATDGQGLIYNGTSSLWLPSALPTDHAQLTGLADDDHLQYFTQARGDARWAQLTTAQLGALVLDARWVDYGGNYGTSRLTKVGNIVTMEMMVKAVTAHDVIKGGTSTVGTIPVGFRPAHGLLSTMTIQPRGGMMYSRLDVGTTGVVNIKNDSSATFSFPVGAWVAPRAAWRVAP